MSRFREKNLNDEVVASIVLVLDGWSGKLSWDALIAAIEHRIGLRYTRQALHRHERVRIAFNVCKNAVAGQTPELKRSAATPELQVALDHIFRLERENRRLTAENSNLLEQFARWAYNAQTRNLTSEFLNNPLPSVDRDQSDRSRPTRKPRDRQRE